MSANPTVAGTIPHMSTDRSFMDRAIELASQFDPHPNPRVGCVIVDASGSIIGEGAHHQVGTPHAERHALDMAGNAVAGATVYVTLEPCSHHGRTGPCADALIEARVSRVVVAVVDPDHRVRGAGIRRLSDAGIAVETGLAHDEAVELDSGYFHHRRTGRPEVHVVLTNDADPLSDAARSDLASIRDGLDYVVGGAGDLLAHPGAAGVSLERQLTALGADGVVELGVRDDDELIGLLASDSLVDRVTAYTAGPDASWGPLGDLNGFTVTQRRTIGPETRHDARRDTTKAV